MKTNSFKKIASLIVMVAALACCQKKEGSVNVNSRGVGPRTWASQSMNASGLQLRGKVFSDAYNQSNFEQAVKGFLETDVRPEYIGFVSATPGQNNSGVFFGGRVAPSSGTLRNAQGYNITVASNSRFVIQVFDAWAGNQSTTLIPPFVFSSAQGTISGNQVDITFYDNYGSVTLRGQYDQSVFRGWMSYDNKIKYDGTQPGAAGELGNFEIATCEFFVCN
jgi:hypothetical protein